MPTGKKTVLNVFLYLILSNLLPVTLHAQSGNIAGTVTDSSRRGVLVGAQVQVVGQPFSTSTDESGKYLLLGVPAGNEKVTVLYLGLSPSTMEIPVLSGDTVTLDLRFPPQDSLRR
jgi:Carboxypeptidase regulatory-like domain